MSKLLVPTIQIPLDAKPTVDSDTFPSEEVPGQSGAEVWLDVGGVQVVFRSDLPIGVECLWQIIAGLTHAAQNWETADDPKCVGCKAPLGTYEQEHEFEACSECYANATELSQQARSASLQG